ncbi:MAG TPA: UDP-N-acetylmuramoyl-L-alanyl-D-glutamate--2,6-diaminopimelate ligase [Eubacteriaceae bacterium]|nr:UDP-N-acetylmuramoyl-L-alanyl-D-glutamate--2,6-diaminopimelate ligase [Eubacteriaceae bacterium]
MKISELLKGLKYQMIEGEDVSAEGLCFDSRKCRPNDVFFAIPGFQTDGNRFIKDAFERGAVAAVVETVPQERLEGKTIIKVEGVRKALSRASHHFYQKPSHGLKVIGVTGTNGKTSTVFFLKELLEKRGEKVGIIGTVGNFFADRVLKSTHTTPESLEIHQLLHEMYHQGASYVIMEVSSHGLSLSRVEDVRFQGTLFTNLSQDHLDFHHTMEEYYQAKRKLFVDSNGWQIMNTDDEYGRRLYREMKKENKNIFALGKTGSEDFVLEIQEKKFHQTVFLFSHEKERTEFVTDLIGEFTVYNLSGAIAAAVCEGHALATLAQGVAGLKPVPGRLDAQLAKEGFKVIIDYAHTPDGLLNVLKALEEEPHRKIITVFGCGGDRDKGKRPKMGKIAQDKSDITFVTSDNPRTEDEMAIIKDILEGMDGSDPNLHVVQNRYDAIKEAIHTAQKEDVVLIAGKGHETYQIFKDRVIDFDEKVIVKEILEANEKDLH